MRTSISANLNGLGLGRAFAVLLVSAAASFSAPALQSQAVAGRPEQADLIKCAGRDIDLITALERSVGHVSAEHQYRAFLR